MKSAKLRALRALVSYAPRALLLHALRAVVPQVPHALRALVLHVLHTSHDLLLPTMVCNFY